MRRFEGKVALVTGGSKGIGRATALRLAQEGASVAITYFRDRSSAEKTAAEIAELGGRCHTARASLAEPQAASHAIKECEDAFGPPHLLVSNAASGVIRKLSETDDKHWDWTMDTNARALLRLVNSAGDNLEAVVAVSSLGSTRVFPLYGLVGVSKAAIESLVRYLATELAPKTRVNTVSASALRTASLEKFPNAEELLSSADEKTPAGRLVTPADVAASICYLLSEDAAMITGQTLIVDGGLSLLV